MRKLAGRRCVPCEGGLPSLERKQTLWLLKQLKPVWKRSVSGKTLFSKYMMKNFREAVRFIDRIALVAEREDHHPDLYLTGYRRLKIELSTHAIGGLSENDFILAAKIDKLPRTLK